MEYHPRRLTTGRVMLLALVTLLSTRTVLARPAVFADLDLSAARAAIKPDQLLIVDVGATWCGPCKLMDRTTWVNPDVVAWIKAHGLAIQIMGDLTPEPANELRVAAYPTLVVIKNGQELDRASGYLPAEQLLTWFEGLSKGQTRLTELREQAGIDGPGPIDVSARMQYAQALIERGQFDQGVSELVWLWRNVGPEIDLRSTPLPMLTQMTLQARPAAHEAFVTLRDEQTAQADAPAADPVRLERWALLIAVLGETEPILAWHQEHGADASPEQRKVMIPWVEMSLAASDRWAELGKLHADPLAVTEERAAEFKKTLDEQIKSVPPDQAENLRRGSLQMFYQGLADLYAGLLAADRPDQAKALTERLATMDEPAIARVMLVQAALRASQVRSEHRQWLDEAAKSGVPTSAVNALRMQVDQALAGKS